MEKLQVLQGFTNTSTEPVGEIEGYPIKPCMKSGFCCTTSPCGYGAWNEVTHQCKHLQLPNSIGQRDCGRDEWIKANVPGWEFYPAFGGGCCMSMFNQAREQVIANINKLTK